jgi:predicted transcriptional regulator
MMSAMSSTRQRVVKHHDRVTVRLPVDMREAAEKLAERHERTLGGEIRLALRHHIEREAAPRQEARAA